MTSTHHNPAFIDAVLAEHASRVNDNVRRTTLLAATRTDSNNDDNERPGRRMMGTAWARMRSIAGRAGPLAPSTLPSHRTVRHPLTSTALDRHAAMLR